MAFGSVQKLQLFWRRVGTTPAERAPTSFAWTDCQLLARAMPLSHERLLDLRAELFAEDVDIIEGMDAWDESEITEYFESGGVIPSGKEPPPKQEEPIDVADAEPPPPPAAEPPTPPPPSTLEDELSALSIKALKARCAAAGLQTDDCLSKADLVKRALESGSAPPPVVEVPPTPKEEEAAGWWVGLSTKEVKRALERHGINVSSCYERSDFEALAKMHPGCLNNASSPSLASNGGGNGGAATTDFWLNYSAKELRKLLTERHVDISGCLDKDDFLQTANKNRQLLLTPAVSETAAVKSKTPALDARQEREEMVRKEKIRAGLEQLGGVVHGGYQIDIFGQKRGRCINNPKCFRYLPGNVKKMNGCAMQGMGAVTCQRCGWTNIEHEDLGKWSEGEPNLVDEHGDGYKFVNGTDGIRKVKMDPPGGGRRR